MPRAGPIQVLEPFSAPRDHPFPGLVEPSRQHRLDQEELLSRHCSFPEIESIGVDTGGSEVESVQALFQCNVLSKRTLPRQSERTEEALRRDRVARGMDLFESVREATLV